MKITRLLRRASALVVLALVLAVSSSADAQVEPRPVYKGTKYKIRVDSSPQQAAVYIDDKKYGIVGYTPWEGTIVKGNWKLIVEKEGYEPSEKPVIVARTKKLQEFFLPLTKKVDPGRIDVRTDADANVFNAEVWLDGQLQGNAPIVLTVDDGRHQIEVKKADFDTFTQWVTTKEGEKVTVNPVLREIKKVKKGSVLVEADVPGAEVYIDGNKHTDVTPTMIPGLDEGPHIIEVRKEPAVPWKQTITVVADKTVKVSAELKATIGGQGGVIRVLSNVDKADVYLDGTKVGVTPLDIKDVKIGEHVVEVKAVGYMPGEEHVVVNAGLTVMRKFELNPEAASKEVGVLKVVSPVAEAEVVIDGAVVGKVPQEKELAPGEHFVGVNKPGYAKFEQKVRIEAGRTLTVTAELKAAGKITVLSTPVGAEVLINGVPAGATPLNNKEVEVGETVVTVRLADYYDFEKTIKVEGGKTEVLSARLEHIDDGPTAAELEREQRALASFGARTLAKGRSTIDFGMGYPYIFDLRITVGAGRLSNFGFDAGVSIRSFLTRTELSIHSRLMLADQEPFSAGVFGQMGYGSTVFGNSGRNGFETDLGGVVSLTALANVTVSGKLYFQYWNDRHCPSIDDAEFADKAIQTCLDYRAFTTGGSPEGFGQAEKDRVDELIGADNDTSLFERESGARLMTSLAVEVAVRQRWNMWFLFEGAPFQSERALYTDPFNRLLFDDDIGTYFRLGVTYKF
jgi:hypothetical protein